MNRKAFDEACNSLIASDSSSTYIKQEEIELKSISLKNDWNWIEHSTYPNFGYLERKGLIRKSLSSLLSTPLDLDTVAASLEDIDTINEVEDPSTLVLASPNIVQPLIKLNLSICLSPTFHVPVLYFTAHFTCALHSFTYIHSVVRYSDLFSQTAGTPLTLDQLLNSTIFHPSPSSSSPSITSNTEYYPHCTLSSSDIRLPYLSQAEHPTTGISSWFLHPCETEGIVREVLLAESSESNETVVEESKDERERRKWELWMRTWLMIVGPLIDLRD